jgi:hypothetical protein
MREKLNQMLRDGEGLTERKIFPYAKKKDFDFARLMPLVRRLVVNHQKDHPWEKMSDEEILKSAGLYQSEPELIEGDVFRTVVPISVSDTEMSDKISDKMSDKRRLSDKKYRDRLLSRLAGNGEISAAEAAIIIERTAKTARRVLLQLVEDGLVSATGANKNRRYKAKH